MAANSLVHADSCSGVLLRHHSREARRAAAALALGALSSTWAGVAHAELAGQSWNQGAADKGSEASVEDEPKVEVMLRASYAALHVGLLGAGVEGAYMMNPHLGFGGTLEGFRVDNGADPQYSEPGTLNGGIHVLAFAEGDLLKGPFTPYARFGIGAGQYHRFQSTTPYSYAETQPEADFVAQAQLGLALRLGPVLARASVSPSIFGKDALVVYGGALGGRF